ncbi:MFS transporter [Streptomyces sp. DSM 44917]|uniref:MFS transporter n=1 Tax=Streptomyces boetiae TaxID=3075541 RepID=A0ABU2L3E1_9ACTN|nr:MFS transporter [Streptomyces sp. DSM 44917]MDT0305833.1 MFS transporter [Streptomyces sp. DSM 44917]
MTTTDASPVPTAAVTSARGPWPVALVVCLAASLLPISLTGGSLAAPRVGSHFDAGVAATQWVANAYMLTFAGFMAITGSLADRAGRRKVFLAGLTAFAVAGFVAAAGPAILVVDLARAVAGAGAASVVTSGSAILADRFTGEAKNRVFALFGTSFGLGLALGPVIGGALISLGGWRLLFGVIAGVATVLVVVSPLVIRESRGPGGTIDWAGGLTFTAALSALIFALVEAQQRGFGHPVVLAGAVAGVGLMVAFGAIERRRPEPLFDVSLLALPKFLAVCVVPTVLAFGFVALLVVLPPYLESVEGADSGELGLLLAVMTVPALIVPAFAGLLARRLAPRTILVLSLLVQGAGAAWLATDFHPVGLALVGAGFGLSLAVLDGTAVSVVEPSRSGMAAGLFNTVRLTGEAVGIAAVGAAVSALLHDRIGADAAADLLTGETAGGLSGDYTSALSVVLWTVTVLSLAGAAVVWRLLSQPEPEPEPAPATEPAVLT